MTDSCSIPDNIKELVKEYRNLRPVMVKLHAELSRLIRKDEIFACAKRLKMLRKQDGKKSIVFVDEIEIDAFEDYLIYMHRPHGINAVQQILNAKRYSNGSNELRLLEGMVKARFLSLIHI